MTHQMITISGTKTGGVTIQKNILVIIEGQLRIKFDSVLKM